MKRYLVKAERGTNWLDTDTITATMYVTAKNKREAVLKVATEMESKATSSKYNRPTEWEIEQKTFDKNKYVAYIPNGHCMVYMVFQPKKEKIDIIEWIDDRK